MNVEAFKGLNNVGDPMRLGLDWLVQADNIDIDDTGAISARAGHARTFSGALTGAFCTLDYSRMYVVDGDALRAMTAPDTAVTLATGLSSAPMYWAEVNSQVFFSNGTDSGIILGDHTRLAWAWTKPTAPSVAAVTGNLSAGQYQVCVTYTLWDGRTTGSSDPVAIELAEGQALQISAIPQLPGHITNVYIAPADSDVFQYAGSPTGTATVWNAPPESLGRDLTTLLLDPLPRGATVIQAWRGRVYAAEYLPGADATAVWVSQPLGFHLFNLAQDNVMVPGRVLMLAPHEDALIIGTDDYIATYDGKQLKNIADYGVVPGWCWTLDDDDSSVLMWTTRGVCRGLPIANLTSSNVSVAPGIQAGAALIRSNGQKKFVVALHAGGTAFNQRN